MACSPPGTASELAPAGIVPAAEDMKNGVLSSWGSARETPFLYEFVVEEN